MISQRSNFVLKILFCSYLNWAKGDPKLAVSPPITPQYLKSRSLFIMSLNLNRCNFQSYTWYAETEVISIQG